MRSHSRVRVHGVTSRWVPTMSRSSSTAITTQSTQAAISSALKLVRTPSAMRLPRPPLATRAPTVVSATVETVATRRPAIITGSASGSSILRSWTPAVAQAARGLAYVVGHGRAGPSRMLRTRIVSA